MDRSTFLIVLAFLLIALLAGCGCICFTESKVWTKSEQDLALDAGSLDALKVTTYNGKVKIVALENGEAIDVHITRKAGGQDEFDAARCMEAIEITEEVEGTTQILSWKWKDREEAKRRNWGASVSFEVRLPARFQVDAETYNGAVSMTGMHARAAVKAYNGEVAALDHEGDLEMETYNGSIKARTASPNVRLETYNGTIDADLAGLSVGGLVKTYNGSIHVALDGPPSTRFVCETHNGRIKSSLNAEVKSKGKRHLEAVIGSGGDTLNLETYNGSITIN
jgi:hypothetical protein